MSAVSKSPNRVAVVAYAVAKQSLPACRHLKSPKKLTQRQLAAILILCEFFTTGYRGIETILRDNSDLRKILESGREVPRYATIQKAAHRIKKKELGALFRGFIDAAQKLKIFKDTVTLSAIDGTGFETRHVSGCFVRRRAKGEQKSTKQPRMHSIQKQALSPTAARAASSRLFPDEERGRMSSISKSSERSREEHASARARRRCGI